MDEPRIEVTNVLNIVEVKPGKEALERAIVRAAIALERKRAESADQYGRVAEDESKAIDEAVRAYTAHLVATALPE